MLDALEAAHGLALDLELQVETPQAVLGADGTVALARMVHAAGPRLTGLHYGTYDYSAALGIAAAHQSSDHPAADLAKDLMQVAVAGTGAVAVDGSTNVLPVGDDGGRCTRPGGCTPGWSAGRWSAASTRAGTCTRRSWSPATRPPTPSSGPRCRPPPPGWPPTWTGWTAAVLDEPATARALAGVVLRGLDCGALDEAEVAAATGRPVADLAAVGGRPAR